MVTLYRGSHLLVGLGLVYFDLSVPPSCLALPTKPLLPNSHFKNIADSVTLIGSMSN